MNSAIAFSALPAAPSEAMQGELYGKSVRHDPGPLQDEIASKVGRFLRVISAAHCKTEVFFLEAPEQATDTALQLAGDCQPSRSLSRVSAEDESRLLPPSTTFDDAIE